MRFIDIFFCLIRSVVKFFIYYLMVFILFYFIYSLKILDYGFVYFIHLFGLKILLNQKIKNFRSNYHDSRPNFEFRRFFKISLQNRRTPDA